MNWSLFLLRSLIDYTKRSLVAATELEFFFMHSLSSYFKLTANFWRSKTSSLRPFTCLLFLRILLTLYPLIRVASLLYTSSFFSLGDFSFGFTGIVIDCCYDRAFTFSIPIIDFEPFFLSFFFLLWIMLAEWATTKLVFVFPTDYEVTLGVLD